MPKYGSRCIYLLVVLLDSVFLQFFYMCFQKNANTLSKKKGNFDCRCETEPSESNFDDETFHAEKKLQWFILIYYMIRINSKKEALSLKSVIYNKLPQELLWFGLKSGF